MAERIFRRKDYYITSEFGNRIHPITKEKSFHYGCDYGTDLHNWEQYALEDGVVIAIKTSCKDKDGNGYGNYVKVKYPRLGIQLLHAHLKEVKVSNGQNVTKNTILGTTGTTGNSTGIHLHLGMQKINSTTWLDPEQYDYVEGEKINMKFEEGNKVIIKGDLYYGSNDEEPRGYTEEKVTYITRVAEKSKHPYNTTGDLGWMDEKDIKLYEEPIVDYKTLYENEVEKNKKLEEKINGAIDVLKKTV